MAYCIDCNECDNWCLCSVAHMRGEQLRTTLTSNLINLNQFQNWLNYKTKSNIFTDLNHMAKIVIKIIDNQNIIKGGVVDIVKECKEYYENINKPKPMELPKGWSKSKLIQYVLKNWQTIKNHEEEVVNNALISISESFSKHNNALSIEESIQKAEESFLDNYMK
jgi:hypothetical protein